MARMLVATEHVRRMRGGAQAHLMRCDDQGYYVVKFQNNPQHLRILANEMLATRLAARLGLCVPQVEVVEVRPELIQYTAELVMQLGLGRQACAAGKQFGSQFPGHPARLTVHDLLPDEQLCQVRNLVDFLGIFVFDKWTCNTNGRQAIFFREPEDQAAVEYGEPYPYADPRGAPDARRGVYQVPYREPSVPGGRAAAAGSANAPANSVTPSTTSQVSGDAGLLGVPDLAKPDAAITPYVTLTPYVAMMIDHGFCFNAGEWDFPDAPLRSLYPRHRVYQNVSGMDSFEPWLERLEKGITEAALGEEAERIPPEWYDDRWDELERLIERLYARRKRIRELIISARNSNRNPFPNWKVRHA